MEFHHPFLAPSVQAIEVFLEYLCIGNAVDGSIYDGIICKEPDVGLDAVSDIIDIHQEESRPQYRALWNA